MDRKRRFSNWYVKYIIKHPFAFYAFLVIGILLFIILSLNIKIDIIETESAAVQIVSEEAGGTRLIINDEIELCSSTIYLYEDRNIEIMKNSVRSVHYDNGKTILVLDSGINIYESYTVGNESLLKLVGNMNVDVVVGKQSLLKLIFVKVGKG